MMRSPAIIMAIIVVALAAAAVAAEGKGKEPIKLPPPVAAALSAAQEALRNGQPQQALERLSAYKGEDHALRHLLLGHACVRLGKLDQAAAAYQRALEMDAEMRQAGLALAQVRGRQRKWPDAARLMGRYVRLDDCEADLLLLYAQIAAELHDSRLCRLLVRRGVSRFPADMRFRRLDLHLLLDDGDYRGAERVLRYLLAKAPTDASLWQQLAFVHGQLGSHAGRLAALEVALLCEPTSLALHRLLMAERLAAGDWLTAVRQGQELLRGPLAKAASADGELMGLLIGAADMGEQDGLLAAWLARLGERHRGRAARIAAARLALRQGRATEARQSLGRLIAAGEADAAVFLWAGHLAERAEDWPAAVSLYAQARRLEGGNARLATLYLSRLHARRGRYREAIELLRGHLDAHPEDAPARALLSLVEARMRQAEQPRGEPAR